MPDISQTLEDFKGALALSDYNTIHPSFLKEILPEKLNHFSAFTNNYLFFKLQHYLDQKLNLKTLTPELCHHPLAFFLTLESQDCDWLEKTLGALCLSHEIKRVITLSEKTELIHFLGESIYDFTLKQGELHRPFLPTVNIEPSTASLVEKISVAGHFLLEYLWSKQPESLAKYFAIKMDKSISWNFNHEANLDLQQHLLILCKRLLLKKGTQTSC